MSQTYKHLRQTRKKQFSQPLRYHKVCSQP